MSLGSGRRVLLVDDDQSLLWTMAVYLSRRGHLVHHARTSAEALAVLAAVPHELVISDLYLAAEGQDNGLDLLEIARRRHPRLATMLLTGSQAPQLEREAHRRGVQRVMYKNQRLAEIALAVTDLLGEPSTMA